MQDRIWKKLLYLLFPAMAWEQLCIRDRQELRAFIEKAGMPAGCTLLGLSAVPTDHPLNKGMLGMHGNLGPNINTNKCDVDVYKRQVKTPANVAQYVVLSDTQMKVYLNLDAIIANVKRLGSSTKAIDMSEDVYKRQAACYGNGGQAGG